MNHREFEINWPRPHRKKIYPIFIPFLGCKKRCIFCAQDIQTGIDAFSLKDLLEETKDFFISTSFYGEELAFYGGTFTSLPEREWKLALEFAEWAINQGYVSNFRCSTRPDYITQKRLKELAEAGCSTVEYGIQTFDEYALAKCGREYSYNICKENFNITHETGLKIGAQLMPGFPYIKEGQFARDVATALSLGAEIFRFYPCLVFKNTGLATLYKAGLYQPLDLKSAIRETVQGWLLVRKQGRYVARLGIAEQNRLSQNILAGPTHNAFGNLVMAEALYICLKNILDTFEHGVIFELYLPMFVQGYLWGWKNELKPFWKNLGVTKNNIFFHEKEKIIIRLQN